MLSTVILSESDRPHERYRKDGRSTPLKVQDAEIEVAEMSDVEPAANTLKGDQRAYHCLALCCRV